VVRKLDKIVIGGGLYGLYAALRCGHRGESIVVLEADESVFSRATYVNQARVHQGYHYPRPSLLQPNQLTIFVGSAMIFRFA